MMIQIHRCYSKIKTPLKLLNRSVNVQGKNHTTLHHNQAARPG